jgi:hypothetical protein
LEPRPDGSQAEGWEGTETLRKKLGMYRSHWKTREAGQSRAREKRSR